MPVSLIEKIQFYVADNIGVFHNKRIASLDTLRLGKVLKRKNPYLFRAKNALTTNDIVKGIVDAHISSNEETIFGDWLEGLAIFINQQVYNGYKSGIEGIDLEFEKNKVRYIVAIKSGPNWANASQVKKMREDFRKAQKTLRTSNSNLKVVAINGCCYGKQKFSDKGDYLKLCGQEFWEFISGEDNLYKDIIKPLGFNAKQKNEDFEKSYSQLINRFLKDFSDEFCLKSGEIDWEKLVSYNSAKE